ncbi:MAG: ParB/RepB/Spo0J family partition protein [Lactobacillales bacterium]|jgi:ParB-like chromosome segregation protein Spo0J|nr:ParB/RepB/Spo0J family partition protein [Lactobacillales bacterium]
MGESFVSPVYHVIRVPIEKIQANVYNPNCMASPEMKLLKKSIWEDGYTMPIVCYYLKKEDRYEIVDGFHRYLVMKNSEKIAKREENHLPVSVIDKPVSHRMASTVRHNRARGEHSIDLIVDIVRQLTEAGLSDSWIQKHIGMDNDELLRLKQISGLATLFAENDFSEAWTVDDII